MIVLFLIAAIVFISFAGCSGSAQKPLDSTGEPGHNPGVPASIKSDLNDPFSASDKEVDYKGYYEIVKMQEGTSDEVGQGTYYIVVKNNTDAPLNIEAVVTAKDSSGNILKKETAIFECVGSNEVLFNYVIFDARYPDPFDNEYPGPVDANKIANIDVDLSYTKNTQGYKPIVSTLEVKKYENKDKKNVVVTAVNRGDYNAYMPEAHVLFFDKNDNVIGHDSILFADEDLELKSGDMQFGEVNLYTKEYDHTELYMSGYSNGSTAKHTDTITRKDLEIVKEINLSYSGEHENVRCMRYLIVKNNSNVEAEIAFESIAWGKNDHALATGLGEIDVLAPGQTSICSVMYSEVVPNEIDHIDDVVYFKTKSLNYTDILDSLSLEVSKNDSGVMVSVTNTGNESAGSVVASVFF